VTKPHRIEPGPGQESVWDYPRPPRVEDTSQHIRVIFNGVLLAETRRAKRVLETGHPPVYYIPPEDVRLAYLRPTARRTMCEWKGQARYYTVRVGDKEASNAAWSYPTPTPAFASIRDCVAFYAHRMDVCTVDGERVQPQPGDFYGGWITRDIVGPSKGLAGSGGGRRAGGPGDHLSLDEAEATGGTRSCSWLDCWADKYRVRWSR
jgi:uncharacterized protein (DUF427 family)